MESEATPTVEANFRPPETRGNFNVETPADSGVMDINSQEYAEYKSGIEAADQARLAEVRADLAEFMNPPQNETAADFEPFTQPADIAEYAAIYNWGSNKEQREKNLEVVGGKYIIEYVPKDVLKKGIYGITGANGSNYARVREDLPLRVKNFVKAHELYHLQDTKGGKRWQEEARADFYPALKDPVGYFATLIYSLRDDDIKADLPKTFKKAFGKLFKPFVKEHKNSTNL